MARFIKKQKQEIGASPDELIFRGEKKTDNVLLRIIDFNADNLEEVVIPAVNDLLSYQEKESVTWFNIDGLHNAAVMEEIAKGCQLDNLIMADVMNTHTGPKVQEYENCIMNTVISLCGRLLLL